MQNAECKVQNGEWTENSKRQTTKGNDQGKGGQAPFPNGKRGHTLAPAPPVLQSVAPGGNIFHRRARRERREQRKWGNGENLANAASRRDAAR